MINTKSSVCGVCFSLSFRGQKIYSFEVRGIHLSCKQLICRNTEFKPLLLNKFIVFSRIEILKIYNRKQHYNRKYDIMTFDKNTVELEEHISVYYYENNSRYWISNTQIFLYNEKQY